MELTKEALKEFRESKLSQRFIDELIKGNGETNEDTFIGKYKGFFIIESDTDEENIAVNNKYYKENGFYISSWDGVKDLKILIDEEIEAGFKA